MKRQLALTCFDSIQITNAIPKDEHTKQTDRKFIRVTTMSKAQRRKAANKSRPQFGGIKRNQRYGF